MSEHRIAWTLHNFEMEQTIIRLRNTRNRLLDRNNWKFPGAEAIETYRDEIHRLERDNASLADRISGAELERDRLGAELKEVKAVRDNLSGMLDRVTVEAFNSNDTISLEPYDEYLLRMIAGLKRKLNESKLYISYLEDNMTTQALRFAQAGFDIEKSRIPIAGQYETKPTET